MLGDAAQRTPIHHVLLFDGRERIGIHYPMHQFQTSLFVTISLFTVSILIPDSARFCNFCRKNIYSLGKVLQAYTGVLLHINASEI